MKTQYPKLHSEVYEYIRQIADTHTVEELEAATKDLKKEQYHDYKGNTGLIQTLERATNVKKAIETRKSFRSGASGIEDIYWSPFEEVDETEEAAYLNLVDSYYEN